MKEHRLVKLTERQWRDLCAMLELKVDGPMRGHLDAQKPAVKVGRKREVRKAVLNAASGDVYALLDFAQDGRDDLESRLARAYERENYDDEDRVINQERIEENETFCRELAR